MSGKKKVRYNKDGSIDKRSFNGGHKSAGRKTKAETMGLEKALVDAIPFEEVLALVAESAREGNWNAQKELLDRYAGKVADKSIIKSENVNHNKYTHVDLKELLDGSYKPSSDSGDISGSASE